MRRAIAALVLSVTLTLATGVGASTQATGTLELNAEFDASYAFGPNNCPPEAPATAIECIRFIGGATIRGLGEVTSTYVKYFDTAACPEVTQFKTAVLEVEGRGAINVSMPWPRCGPTAPAVVEPMDGSITGGSGQFARASGSLQFRSVVDAARAGAQGPTGRSTDTWSGMLVVPGHEFDLTPPVLNGAVSKTARAPRGAKRARVRYRVTARDDVDPSVAVECEPRSGSLFRVGRTTVRCLAVDSSANQTTARFTIVVKRRR
jgi:HYR domain